MEKNPAVVGAAAAVVVENGACPSYKQGQAPGLGPSRQVPNELPEPDEFPDEPTYD